MRTAPLSSDSIFCILALFSPVVNTFLFLFRKNSLSDKKNLIKNTNSSPMGRRLGEICVELSEKRLIPNLFVVVNPFAMVYNARSYVIHFIMRE